MLEWIGVEPHVPLVKDPVDPANRAAGVSKRIGIRGGDAAEDELGVQAQASGAARKWRKDSGWLKSVALGRSRWVGRWKLEQMLQIGAAVQLVRLRTLKPGIQTGCEMAAKLKDQHGVTATDEKDSKPLEQAVFPQPVRGHVPATQIPSRKAAMPSQILVAPTSRIELTAATEFPGILAGWGRAPPP
ncbi:MAG: hypothetical protein U0744_01855 [Gemmataceae bacterium]